MAQPPPTVAPDAAEPYARLARPVLGFVDQIDRSARAGERSLAETAADLLDRFEARLTRTPAPPASIKPARYALAALIDQKARISPRVKLSAWSVQADRLLFEGRQISLTRIRDFQHTAEAQGRDFAALAAFLAQVLTRAEDFRQGPRRTRSGWGLTAALSVAVFLFGLAAYAVFLEYRYQASLYAGFRSQTAPITETAGAPATTADRLTAMRTAVDKVAEAAARAPFRGTLRLPLVDARARATKAHAQLAQAELPRAIGAEIEDVLAIEGRGLLIYDALRAWSVLTGDLDWQPAYLQGWLEDNAPALAPHVTALTGPSPGLAATDPELLTLVRSFGAEADETERAWLELLRAEGTRALPRWRPAERIPGIDRVLVRRSGADLTDGLPGLFTRQGWDYARDYGIGIAVQEARRVGPIVTGQPLPSQNATPDLLEDRLLRVTLATWKDWLAELRVRPFVERDTAIVVSGILAQTPNPLDALLQDVWAEVGGTDRSRTHPQQLKIATEFGPMIQYVEAGRLDEIARLFSALNVALASFDVNARRATERLMSLQERNQTVRALQAAPRIVVQIAEDVLAQSSVPASASRGNPIARVWQQDIFPLCAQTVHNRFPFANGPDAGPGEIAALFGPAGALPRFFDAQAAAFLDTSESPWRWKPEARFAGLTPDSAEFLERAMQISQSLYGPAGTLGTRMTLAALAERGETVFGIGGEVAPVRATGAAARLAWPGPLAEQGVEVTFRRGQDSSRLTNPGLWGLMRLLDGLRLRLRDGGARVLVDLRTDTGRVFVEMTFDRALNPVSARSAMRGLTCPPVP